MSYTEVMVVVCVKHVNDRRKPDTANKTTPAKHSTRNSSVTPCSIMYVNVTKNMVAPTHIPHSPSILESDVLIKIRTDDAPCGTP